MQQSTAIKKFKATEQLRREQAELRRKTHSDCSKVAIYMKFISTDFWYEVIAINQ